MVCLRRWIWGLVAVAAVAAAARGADWKLQDERWYEVEIAGAQAGWMHESVWADGERYRTAARTRMSIGRGPVEVTIQMTSTVLETRDGELLLMRLVQEMGEQPVDTEWLFEADRVVETARQGGREVTWDRPLPEGEWLTPMAARRRFNEARGRGEQTITYRTLDPQNGLEPITVTMVFAGEEQYRLEGRVIPVTAWTSTTSLLPFEARELYDEAGHAVFQSIEAPFGTMVTRLSTKEKALAQEGEPAPELLVATFVRPDRPIRRAMEATSARLRLRVAQGALPALPTAGAQRVEPADDGSSAVVTVNLKRNQPAAHAEREPYLARSSMVDAEDPEIRALVAQALRGAEASPLDRAEAMRALVHRVVSEKNLDTAFGTASETARTRSGDCSEHAVLLCAMLRADEIPARVAIGLIYADRFLGEQGIFGWHMWTQALIDGRWVDLDATLPVPYHAGHVLTGTTALAESALAVELTGTLMLIGNLEIEVLDVGYE